MFGFLKQLLDYMDMLDTMNAYLINLEVESIDYHKRG